MVGGRPTAQPAVGLPTVLEVQGDFLTRPRALTPVRRPQIIRTVWRALERGARPVVRSSGGSAPITSETTCTRRLVAPIKR